MPDIEIKCESCTEVTTVSEYADAHSLTCGKCGLKLSKPTAGLKLKQRPRPTVRRQAVERSPEPESETLGLQQSTVVTDDKKEDAAVKTSTKATRQTRKATMKHLFLGWGLFFGIGLIMGWIRYGDALSAVNMEKFQLYGPFAMITIHLTIFVLISKESIFSGIICLIVPFYGLYHIFFVTDAFLLRAIIGGILIGIGEDSFFFFREVIVDFFERADEWIRHGALH